MGRLRRSGLRRRAEDVYAEEAAVLRLSASGVAWDAARRVSGGIGVLGGPPV